MEARVLEMARLLLELGAKVDEDVLYVKVAIDGYGIQFCKRLFAPGLCADSSGKLFYSLKPGREFLSAEILLNHSQGSYYTEYRMHEGQPPRAFWDRAWTMAVALRRRVFEPPELELPYIYSLRGQVCLDNLGVPTRENHLLLRCLDALIQEERQRYRERRRERNRLKGQAFARLFRLVNTAPHSLNLLKTLGSVKVTRITPGYWQVDCWIQGETFSGWDDNPVYAATSLLRLHESLLCRELGIRIAS